MDIHSEYGRLLAQRDRLIAEGVDPSELLVPLPPLPETAYPEGATDLEPIFLLTEERDTDAFEDVRTDPVPVHEGPEDDPSEEHEPTEED